MNRKNLKRLKEMLENLREDEFANEKEHTSVLGHSAHKIKVRFTRENWFDYARRVFGIQLWSPAGKYIFFNTSKQAVINFLGEQISPKK